MQCSLGWHALGVGSTFIFLSPFPVRILHAQSTNISINVDIEAGFYKISKLIRNHTNLCYFQTLDYLGHSDDDDAFRTPACPLRRGPYQLYTSFTVPDFVKNDAEGLAFTPDLFLHFYEENSDVEVGCVETGTLAMVAEGKRNRRRGQRMFMICVLGLALTSAVCFAGHRRRRKAGELAAAKRQRAKLRRFHYRRNTNAVLMTNINPSVTEGSSAVPLREVT
jgi:hypothetical protein